MGQKWDNNDHKSRKNGPNDPKKKDQMCILMVLLIFQIFLKMGKNWAKTLIFRKHFIIEKMNGPKMR